VIKIIKRYHEIFLFSFIVYFLSASCKGQKLQNNDLPADILKVPEKVELKGELKSPSQQSLTNIQKIIGLKVELFSKLKNPCTENIEGRYVYEDIGIILLHTSISLAQRKLLE
jgi:hypothetical protein